MYNKKLLILIAAGLLALTTVTILIQMWGIPLKDVLAIITLYALYGLILIAYLGRFALIILGVFALYRILREHHYTQISL